VQKLLDKRDKGTRGKKSKHAQHKTTRVEYLVTWRGYGIEHNEWIAETELERNCKKKLREYNAFSEQKRERLRQEALLGLPDSDSDSGSVSTE